MTRLTDQSTWQRLSPHLDELLDLPAAEQSARLAALRCQGEAGAALADELTALLDRMGSLEQAAFLQAPALPPPPGLAGQTVGAYRLVREVGRGGMGSVWLAQRMDGRYQGQVAIKFMQGTLMRPGDSERFVREGQLLARLDHPHIARLLDAGVGPGQGGQPGQPYLVLDYVDGQPIDQHCQLHQLDTPARVRLMLQVLAAVAHAHSRLILHRDLKPSNILVTADGQPKLLDFGIGKLLSDADTGASASASASAAAPSAGAGSAAGAGTANPAVAPATTRSANPSAIPSATTDELTRLAGLAFTARYAAPEQLLAQEVTTATDVYTLGVLLYGLLGGGHPTELPGAPPVEQMRAVTEREPRRLSDAVLRQGGPGAKAKAQLLRGDLDTIVARALKKTPAQRYANAAALADDLRRWLDHEPVVARPDSAGYRASRFVRRHLGAVVAASSAGALALTAGTGVALWQARQAQAERVQAEALVEFMLGDLKDKLTQLGRVDLLAAVGQQALAYYERDGRGPLEPDDLARHARALRVIGETARQRLDGVQALRGFNQAAAITAALLAQAPDDLARMQDHAESLGKLIEVLQVQGHHGASLVLGAQASDLLHRAAQQAPEQPEVLRRAITRHHDQAYNLIRAGQPAEALALLQRDSLFNHQQADMNRQRADRHLITGMALATLGRYNGAVEAFDACVQVLGGMPETQENVWLRRMRAVALRSLVRAQLHIGQTDAALRGARSIVADGASDANLNTRNPMLMQELLNDQLLLAQALWQHGDDGAARQTLAQAWSTAQAAYEAGPNQVEWHLRTRGGLLALRVRLQPATATDLADMQALMDKLDTMEAAGQVVRGLPLQTALEVGLALGDALAQSGRATQAQAPWRAVAQRSQAWAEKGLPPFMHVLAQAQARLGHHGEAQRWVRELAATPYRHPDLAALQRQLNKPGATAAPPGTGANTGAHAAGRQGAAATLQPASPGMAGAAQALTTLVR